MKLRIGGNILWIDEIPAFLFLPNGEQDPITPTGWWEYCTHKEKIDLWIEKHFKKCTNLGGCGQE